MPCSSSLSSTEGAAARLPKARRPNDITTPPESIRNQAIISVTWLGEIKADAGCRRAIINPSIHNGMPRRSRKITLAHWPLHFPHHREYVLVKALTPFNTKPRINGIRNISTMFPEMIIPLGRGNNFSCGFINAYGDTEHVK